MHDCMGSRHCHAEHSNGATKQGGAKVAGSDHAWTGALNLCLTWTTLSQIISGANHEQRTASTTIFCASQASRLMTYSTASHRSSYLADSSSGIHDLGR